MNLHALEVRIFLSSPGDLQEERSYVRACIRRLQADPFFKKYLSLNLVSWDEPGRKTLFEYGVSPQSAVNAQLPLPESCDIVLVLLGDRMGTPIPRTEAVAEGGESYTSGTQFEFANARQAYLSKGTPRILVFKRTSTSNDVGADQTSRLDVFLDHLRTERFNINYFSEVGDLGLSIEQHLRLLLTPLVERRIQDSLRVRQPFQTYSDALDMVLLVPKLGACKYEGDVLTPCSYHLDRLDVDFFEQRQEPGSERILTDRTSEVTLTPGVVQLLGYMQRKRAPAGHWGLMYTHRAWLTERLASVEARREGSSVEEPIAVLQCGVAGHVHYFGYLKILIETFRLALQSGRPILLHTIDRCATPIVVIRRILDQLRTSFGSIDIETLKRNVVSGYNVPIPRSLEGYLPTLGGIQQHVLQILDINDLAGVSGLPVQAGYFDVATAHFLTSMWKEDTAQKVDRFAANLAGSLKENGRLLVALSELHDIHIRDAGFFHECFRKRGFVLVDCQRTWDVYDLAYGERAAVLREGTCFQVTRGVVLAEYRFCSGQSSSPRTSSLPSFASG